MAKVVVVEKLKSNGYLYQEYFDFKYDTLGLIKSNKTKVLKADVDLSPEELKPYDFIICVGADVCKHIAKIGNVTKYSGELVSGKFLPIINPTMVKFKPEVEGLFISAVDKINKHVEGNYKKSLAEYKFLNNKKSTKKYLLSILKDKNITAIAIDTETTALYPKNGYILGIGISHKENFGVYIDSNIIDDEIEVLLQKLFNKKICVFHGAKFDKKFLAYHFNFTFPKWECTMMLHYILNENEPHDLKYLALKYTDMGDYEAELDKWKKQYCSANGILLKDFTYDLFPTEILWPYGAKDPDATIRIYNKFIKIINKSEGFKKLLNNIMKPANEFLQKIEMTGVPFSKKRLQEAQIAIDTELLELKAGLYNFKEIHEVEKLIGEKFNPGSPQMLSRLLFEVCHFPVLLLTPKKKPSTNKEVLEALIKLSSTSFPIEIPKLIVKIRQLSKIKSTYIDKVLANLDRDSRIRTNFNQTVATSGRLSSSGKFNAQQLPRDNKVVKRCIQAIINGKVNKDYVIVSQDLKTAEMYYAAVLSGDKALMQVFKDGGDFHSSIAKIAFGLSCSVEDVSKKYSRLRQASKAISFGILYGAGAKKIASELKVTVREADKIIKQYFERFSTLKKWLDNTSSKIGRMGYIYSVFDRKRRVKNVFSVSESESGHAIRSALNFLVQSVASDINTMAGVEMQEYIEKTKLDAQIFMLVHDSIVAIVHKKDLEEYIENLKRITQTERGCSIANCPIGVDTTYGDSYAECG